MKAKLVSNFSPRIYQQSIFANSLNKNSLVVLPTGLGKTVISLMLAIYYFNQSGKKVLFLAPTRPLVEQQKKSFESFIENSKDLVFQVFTGQVSPAKRREMYKKCDFIFSTPQLIENDLINSTIDSKDFAFIVFDECHRASGNYAYNFIAEEFSKCNCNFLGLSASPGVSITEVKSIIKNLKIEHIEVKKSTDDDVKPYVKDVEINKIEVELPKEMINISKKLKLVFKKNLDTLNTLGYLKGKTVDNITKRDLLDIQADLRRDIGGGTPSQETWQAISVAAGLMKLQHGIELIESQEVSSAYNYFHSFFRVGGDNSKAVKNLTIDVDFRECYEDIIKLKKSNTIHPKLSKLKDLIESELIKDKNRKTIIFAQYRESANRIVEELSKVKNAKPTIFIGQAKKGENSMSQKDQKKIIENFRENKFNILVSTSVGEEGLDIPRVDSVVFYEPIPSAIRSIQRIGRTGRFEKGHVFMLLTKGTRDIVTNFIATAKEKRMYKTLEEIKIHFKNNESKNNLNKYIKEEEEEEVDFDKIPKAMIDSRENSDLIKRLHREEIKIETKNLEVGDIVLSEDVAIERKAKIDFINSILDKRLFTQLINLTRNYRRPILIIEGPENIFTLRNLNPEVIRATISSIAIDFRVPIIYTDSLEDTCNMVMSIAKRVNKEKKNISINTDKKSSNESEELEKLVSMIPKVNIMTARILLKEFKTIKNLSNASKIDILKCQGIGELRAKYIADFFSRKYE